MGILERVNSGIKKFNWLDIKLLKLGAFCIGLPAGAYFSAWILPYWWIFILLAVLFHARPWHKALRK